MDGMQNEAVRPHGPVEPILRARIFGIFVVQAYDGQEVRFATRKAHALFAYLLMARGEFVLKSKLENLLWGSRFKQQSSASLRQCLADMRRTLAFISPDLLISNRDMLRLNNPLIWIDGVTGRNERAIHEPRAGFLENLRGLSQEFDRWIGGQEAQLISARTNILVSLQERTPDTKVIGVLPITILGRSESQQSLIASELTQQLAMAISRMRWFKVGIVNSGQPVGVAYYLTGSLSAIAAESTLRMTLYKRDEVDLVIWSKSYKSSNNDDIHCIGHIASDVARSIDPELIYLETGLAVKRKVEQLSFREKFLRAIPLIYAFEFNAWRESETLLRECRTADPENARIAAYLALSILTGVAQGWKLSGVPLQESEQLARLASRLDPYDSIAHAVLAHITAFSYHDFQMAQRMFARAVSINPSCGITQLYLSLTMSYMENNSESWKAISAARDSLIYDPYWSIIDACESIHYFFCGDMDTAILKAQAVLSMRPTFTNIRKLLILGHCLKSERASAVQQHEILLKQHPKFSWGEHFSTYPFYNADTRLKMEAAVQTAGL